MRRRARRGQARHTGSRLGKGKEGEAETRKSKKLRMIMGRRTRIWRTKKKDKTMEEGKEENVGGKEEESKRPGKTHWLTSRRARMRRRLYIARVYTYVPSPLFSSIAGQFARLAGLPKEIIPPARGPSHRQRAPTFLLLPMPCMVSCPTAEKSICQNPNH